jgi:hypothetical protein
MHLEGPWLSTTGKKKGKRKWASAEAKRQAENLKRDWEERLRKFDKEAPRFSGKTVTVTKKPTELQDVYSLTIPPGRVTQKINSLPFTGGPCPKPADKVYTGTKIKGIGTMHKSNAVPIFSDEEAVDISRMRR